MRKKLFVSFLFIVAFLSLATTSFASGKAESLARQAVSENPVESKKAIASLRSMGEDGLMSLFAVYANDIRRYMQTGEQTAQWSKIANALDSVAMQKDSYASRLFWQTDFEAAKREAQKSGKPILSLRLLGNLNEEFSCANSRFFRSVLYANDEVSKILRERFVLHWKSVRPAPRITIDFGDGRKIERTITGNSIHYILDSNGQPIDAIAGLNGPTVFKRWLIDAETLAKQINGKTEAERWIALNNFHRSRINKITNDWATDLEKSGVKLPKEVAAKRSKNPTAIDAAPLAVTKRVVEIDILKAITADATILETNTNLDDWKKIAALHRSDATLDKNSVAMIGRQTFKKGSDENLSKLINNFESFIALDTVRNEYLMHTKLHALFVAGYANDLDRLNEKVYAELFLTPSTDPWLGLYSPDTYTAIDGGGIIK
jgi:hypothetical protein